MIFEKLVSLINHIYNKKENKRKHFRTYAYPYETLPIDIANEFAEYLKKQKKTPIRKATGVYSDEAAQAFVRG